MSRGSCGSDVSVQSQPAVQMRNSTVKPVILQTSCWLCHTVNGDSPVLREGDELTQWCAHCLNKYQQLDNL